MRLLRLRDPGGPTRQPKRTRRGQTLVEFALTLPILLLLVFAIIEFGRIFQAWVTIQNAARAAARFAITGNFDQTLFQDINNPWSPSSVGGYRDGRSPDLPVDYSQNYPEGQKPGDGVACTLQDTRGAYSTTGVNVGGDIFRYDITDAAGVNYGHERMFASHWNGQKCDPSMDEHRWLRNDILRLVSMTEEARIGAAGLALAPWMRIPGTGINTEPDGDASLRPGWFHVFVCSSRPQFSDPTKRRYLYAIDYRTDGTNYGFDAAGIRLCTIEEVSSPNGSGGTDMNAVNPDWASLSDRRGINQYDAGGPGDFVEVVVYFNHPLVTPLGLGRNDGTGPYVLLQARRTMINEAFRSARVLDLPSLRSATLTAVPQTPTWTFTPSITNTRTVIPTNTWTATSTHTLTPTQSPVCTNLSLVGPDGSSTPMLRLESNKLNVYIQNTNPGPVYVRSVRMVWEPNVSYPNLYPTNFKVFEAETNPLSPHWLYSGVGTPPRSNTTVSSATSGWVNTQSYREIAGAGARSKWQASFANGPSQLTDIYTVNDFTTVEIKVEWPGQTGECTLTWSATHVPTPPPTEQCEAGAYALTFSTFQQYGVVRFDLNNSGTLPVRVTGFSLNWKSYFPGMNVGKVGAKGATAFSPDTVNMYTMPPGQSPPAAYSSNTVTQDFSASSERQASFPPSSSGAIWLDFEGTNDNLQAAYPGQVFVSDFNGSYVILNGNSSDPNCRVQVPDTAPPAATATFTLTPSSTLTLTPSNTNTSTSTLTPSYTYTPSLTLTPSYTYTASMTYTQSFTVTPSLTLNPANLLITTWTCDISNRRPRLNFQMQNNGPAASPASTSFEIWHTDPNPDTRRYNNGAYASIPAMSLGTLWTDNPSAGNQLLWGANYEVRITIGSQLYTATTRCPDFPDTNLVPTGTCVLTGQPPRPQAQFVLTNNSTTQRSANGTWRIFQVSNGLQVANGTFGPIDRNGSTFTGATFSPALDNQTYRVEYVTTEQPPQTLTVTTNQCPATPAATPSYTHTYTQTASQVPTNTFTPTASNTHTATLVPTFTFTPTASLTPPNTPTDQYADLGITQTIVLHSTGAIITDGDPYVLHSQQLDVTIVITNNGDTRGVPDPFTGTTTVSYDGVVDSRYTNWTSWTCTRSGGGACTGGTNRNISAVFTNVAVGETVTIRFSINTPGPSVVTLAGIPLPITAHVAPANPVREVNDNTAPNRADRTIMAYKTTTTG